jgi:S-DNA-T family DNA segregation ATPase FtsK/SpoIIIE
MFGIVGMFLGFSVTAAFLDTRSVLSAPGSFFIRSYGLLAFVVPGWLLYAAYLLADTRYRPDRIFVLCGAVVPFMTLAVGFYWIREYETVRLKSLLAERAGKFGIGFFIIILAVMEIFLIALLRFLLFGRNDERAAPVSPAAMYPDAPASPDAAYPPAAGQASAPKGGSRNLTDIYAASAAAMADGPDTGPEPGPEPAEEASSAAPVYVTPPAPDTAREAARAAAREPENPGGAAEEAPGAVPVTAGEETTRDAEPPADSGGPAEEFPTEEAPEGVPWDEDAEEEAASDANEDVEKALAEAEAFASAHAEEEAARGAARRHGDNSDVGAKAAPPKRKSRLPYSVPVEGILKQYPDGEYWIIDEETRDAALTLKETFKEFNIQVEVTGIRKGPVITMFEILPAPGIRLAKIENLADNIALRLAAQSVRIVAPIPGKHAVGIEVPNARRSIVSFREIIEGELGREGKKAEVPVVLGKDITGEAVTVDLAQMPHLLIAGATGSGKSVCVNSMILSILYRKPPFECRLLLIDPKIVELKLYNDIPHLLTPVITEPKKAFQALQYCIYEMERRYACLDSVGVRDVRSYNRRIRERNIAAEHMPYIVVVIDEFADLMATTGKELESTVARLAAMSRAVGIHLVLATQRPSIDVITGLIKANIPSRIAFMVASKMDSRIIIDLVGAEKLLGKGDMLYAGVVDPFPIRMQGAFVSEEEIERVVEYVKGLGEPDYIDDEIFFDDEEDADPSLFSDGDDPLYDKALEVVCQQGKASASYIQRRLKIGYNRAARLVEEMERRGVVGPAQGSKPRELLRGQV